MKKVLISLIILFLVFITNINVVAAKNSGGIYSLNDTTYRAWAVDSDNNGGISKLWVECVNQSTNVTKNISLYDGSKNFEQINGSFSTEGWDNGKYKCTIYKIKEKYTYNTDSKSCSAFNTEVDSVSGESYSGNYNGCIAAGCTWDGPTHQSGLCKAYSSSSSSSSYGTKVSSETITVTSNYNTDSKSCSAFNTEIDSVSGESYSGNYNGCIAAGCKWDGATHLSGKCIAYSSSEIPNSINSNNGDSNNKNCESYSVSECPFSCSVKEGKCVNFDENTCEGLLGSFYNDLQSILNAIKIIGPIIVFGLSTFEYITAIVSKEGEGLKKANDRLIKRLVLIAVLFFLPLLINILLGLTIGSEYSACLS